MTGTTITDKGCKLIQSGLSELEEVECIDCGEIVYATREERQVRCKDHA